MGSTNLYFCALLSVAETLGQSILFTSLSSCLEEALSYYPVEMKLPFSIWFI
jgi:hypothetical protein